MPIIKNLECHKCGTDESRYWYREYDENKEWTGFRLCYECYLEIGKNTRKFMAKARNIKIDMNNFESFHENEKGRIGEDIVSATLNIRNQNDISDNYVSRYDLEQHPEYGRIQVKIATLDFLNNCYDCTLGIDHQFDTLIIICMDNEKPWKNVERVFIIPEEELYDECYINITNDEKCRWNRFRADEIYYNQSYHNMDIYKNYFNKGG